mgnify:CR=1 FL=1
MSELVMVIEDEKEIRDLVRYNLEKAGFRVAAAGDGEEDDGELRMREGESIDDFKARLKAATAPKKTSITGDMLDARLPEGRARELLSQEGHDALFDHVITPFVRRYGHDGVRADLKDIAASG